VEGEDSFLFCFTHKIIQEITRKIAYKALKKITKDDCEKNGKRPLPKMKNTSRLCQKEPLLENGRKTLALFVGGLENSTLAYAIEIH